MNTSACLLAFVCLVYSPACSQVSPESRSKTQTPKAATPVPEQDGQKTDKRIAMAKLDDCSRDETTFYQGKVLRFRRTSASTEITIRTDWDTTEKLVQANKKHPIEYRLEGQAISERALRQIESRIKNGADVRAIAWICRSDSSEIVKIIEWGPPRLESSP